MAFNRDNRSGGRQSGGGRDFGRRSFGGDRGGFRGGDREMFQTTCSNCGRACEVPFKPTGSKPVYCNDCFKTMGRSDSGQGRSDDRGPRRSFDRPTDRGTSQPQNKEQFDALNAKLDKILRLLNPEFPSAEMPVTENAEPVVKKVRAKKKVAVEAEVPVEESPIE